MITFCSTPIQYTHQILFIIFLGEDESHLSHKTEEFVRINAVTHKALSNAFNQM